MTTEKNTENLSDDPHKYIKEILKYTNREKKLSRESKNNIPKDAFNVHPDAKESILYKN